MCGVAFFNTKIYTVVCSSLYRVPEVMAFWWYCEFYKSTVAIPRYG